MTKLIVQQNSKKPRAIAKEKDGIVMYWVDELSEGGLHVRGLARLLDCHPNTISKVIEAVNQIDTLEAEIVTDGGLQGVTLLTGQNIAKLLRYISRSKAKEVTRYRADDIRDQLVAAGFKLAVMLELAPEKLVPPVEQPRQLPPAVTIYQYMEAAERWGLDSDPLIKSLISQRLAEELGSKALTAGQQPTQVVLTVRATELGYPQNTIGNGSQLGRFVSRKLAPVGKTQHGRYPVNVFEVTPELDETIHAYFR